MDKNKISKYINIIVIVAGIIILLASFLVQRKKIDFRTACKLPFYNTELETVQDGTYKNKTYTKFMHVQLEVTVKDHKIQKINILENKGSYGQKVEPIIQDMISENTAVVTAIKGEEIASLVFISCVDGALQKGAVNGSTEK